MGIYDRDYVRNAPRTGGRGGGRGGGEYWNGRPLTQRIRPNRVNTWLIVINIAVFFIGVVLLGSGAAVEVPQSYSVLQGQTLQGAEPVDPLAATGVRGVGQRPLVNPETGQQVGIITVFVMDPLRAFGHFSTQLGFRQFEVWRLITFQFLHADIVHLFFNMFGLYFFGPRVEEQLGPKRYAAFYLVCGIGGGLLYLLLNLIGVLGINLPGALDVGTTTPLIGASAGVFGVILARAYIDPHVLVQMLFPPITTRIRTLAYVFVGIAALNLVAGDTLSRVPPLNLIFRGNQGGDAAHLGGAIAGYYFVRNPHLLRDFFDVLGNSKLPKGPRRQIQTRRRPTKRDPASGPRLAQGDATDIDTILDKISRSGKDSLTADELRRLGAYSKGLGDE